MPLRVGWVELVILLVIVMMIFGVGKLPQVGNAVGKAIREFRKAQSHDDAKEDEKPTSSNPKTLAE